ncbi:PQQ-binding-like beta-propeller repeat protein [Halomicroarcula sp. GCM10025709]|uniref:outer membrane protein assembly factor BamB family protein n=1 Tax=Halomicroarcula sp. GCM10025709 TaxID=3252669 RepID=UPI00361DEDD7
MDAETGEKRWQTAVNANVGELNVASADGYAVSGGHDGTLHAFDTETGDHAWQRDDLDAYFVTAIGERIYTGGDRFRAIDPATGRTEWAFSGHETDSFAAPAVHDGAFLVPSDGRLYELGADGQRRGAVEMIDEVSTGAAADSAGVYVGAEDASVYAYRHPDT